MDLMIRNFTKLVVLAVVVAVLWYFQTSWKNYGIVKNESESKCIHCNGLQDKKDEYGSLRFESFRDQMETKVLSRGLRWLENSSEITNSKGTPFLHAKTNFSVSLKDDPANDDCADVHKKPMADRCNFVNVTDDCQIDEGFLDYTYFIYCDFQPKLLPLAFILLFLWWLFLFIGLGVTADDFFCPALTVIADTMKLSHNVAGVTFLAFGNGAPDIFSAIAAIGNAKNGDAGLAIGALFGAGVFVTTIVAGVIAIICPFDAMQRPFLRDIIFFIAALFWTFYILWDHKITKFEAIGFVLMYVVYVLVVVIGRYVYTRQRARQAEVRSKSPTVNVSPSDIDQTGESSQECQDDPYKADIQEPSGRDVMNPLDTVTDGERQPLLSNPDVISLTAVRDDGALAQFLRAVSPIDTEQWSGMSMLKKIYNVYKAPLVIFLRVTVSVVNYEDDKQNWNRHLFCLQCILGPVFCSLATKFGLTTIGGTFPVWALVLMVGIMLAAVVFFTSRNDVQPKYHPAFAYLGFLVSVVWIYSIANEIVNILQTFGVVLQISNAILGLTLLAWGNSVGDFIADTVMARQGYPRMGISACFGGPLFNLLLGIGIPFTIATVKNGDYAIKITLEEVILAGFLAFSLCSSLIIVPLSKFRMSRPWGIYLVVLYIVFMIVAILTETGVIHYDIDP